MRCSVVALLLVGLITALSAAVLVSRFTSPPRGVEAGPAKQITLVECNRNIERGVVVLREDVETRSVPVAQAPKGGCQDPAQVIGRVLVVSMSKGEAFMETCFAVEGQGLQIAGRPPEGMRAVSVSVSDSSGLHGLLYPGSVVDVLVSLHSGTGRRSISRTLLEGVQVLAVNEQTLYTRKEEGSTKSDSRYQKMVVTLLVDMEQAQHIQLAVRHGTLSLALRNPRDVAKSSHEATDLLSLLGIEEKKEQVSTAPTVVESEVVPEPPDVDVPEEPKAPRWQITVIQGTQKREVDFDVPEKKDK